MSLFCWLFLMKYVGTLLDKVKRKSLSLDASEDKSTLENITASVLGALSCAVLLTLVVLATLAAKRN